MSAPTAPSSDFLYTREVYNNWSCAAFQKHCYHLQSVLNFFNSFFWNHNYFPSPFSTIIFLHGDGSSNLVSIFVFSCFYKEMAFHISTTLRLHRFLKYTTTARIYLSLSSPNFQLALLVTFFTRWKKVDSRTVLQELKTETQFYAKPIFPFWMDLPFDTSASLLALKLRRGAIFMYKASKKKLRIAVRLNSSRVLTIWVKTLRNNFIFRLKTVAGCGNFMYLALSDFVPTRYLTKRWTQR